MENSNYFSCQQSDLEGTKDNSSPCKPTNLREKQGKMKNIPPQSEDDDKNNDENNDLDDSADIFTGFNRFRTQKFKKIENKRLKTITVNRKTESILDKCLDVKNKISPSNNEHENFMSLNGNNTDHDVNRSVTKQCPLCCKFVEKHLNHMKLCAAKRNVSTEQLLAALKLQEKQAAEREALGLPVFSDKTVIRKNINKKVSSDPNLELALALSVSVQEHEENKVLQEAEILMEAGLEEEANLKRFTLEEFGFGNSKPINKTASGKYKSLVTPILLKRTKEDRERIITEKVAIILVGEDEDNVPLLETFCHVEPEVFSKKLISYLDKEARLWEKSSSVQGQREMFYVEALSEFVSPSKSDISAGLRHLSQLPGRINTPSKIGETIFDSEVYKFPTPNSDIMKTPNLESVKTSNDYITNISTLKKDREIKKKAPSFSTKLLKDWRSIFGKSDMSDITVYCKGEMEIPAHKLVLFVRCQNVLVDVIKESDSNNCSKAMLFWSDFSQSACLTFLEYIYCGFINKIWQLDSQQLMDLKSLAEKYKVFELLQYLNIDSKQNVSRNLFNESTSIKSSPDSDDSCSKNNLDILINMFDKTQSLKRDSEKFSCDEFEEENQFPVVVSECETNNLIEKELQNSDKNECLNVSRLDYTNSLSHKIFTTEMSCEDYSQSQSKNRSTQMDCEDYDQSQSKNRSTEIDCEAYGKNQQNNHSLVKKLNTDSFSGIIESKQNTTKLCEEENHSSLSMSESPTSFISNVSENKRKHLQDSPDKNENNSQYKKRCVGECSRKSEGGDEEVFDLTQSSENSSIYIDPVWVGFDEMNFNEPFGNISDRETDSTKEIVCYNDLNSDFKNSCSKDICYPPPIVNKTKNNSLSNLSSPVTSVNCQNSPEHIVISDSDCGSPDLFDEKPDHISKDSSSSIKKLLDDSLEISESALVESKCPETSRNINKTPPPEICGATNVTPLPDYSAMKTPMLKRELKKYGLKPALGRKKGKLMLRYIYDQLHPFVQSENDDSSSDSLQSSSDNSLSCTALSGSDDEVSSQSMSTSADIHSAVRRLIDNDPDLHEKILLYEPIFLEDIVQMLKVNGFKCNLNQLKDYLDEQCITYRTISWKEGKLKRALKRRKRSRRSKTKQSDTKRKSTSRKISCSKVRTNKSKLRQNIRRTEIETCKPTKIGYRTISSYFKTCKPRINQTRSKNFRTSKSATRHKTRRSRLRNNKTPLAKKE